MKFKQKILSSILVSGLVASNLFISNANNKQLEVHFIDVGQGDTTYIELPNGTDILIDAGESKYGSTVVNYLKNQEKNIEIDYLIATHPDSDHVGGMKDVFKQLNVKNFYYPYDASHNTQTWNNVLNLANEEGCKIVDAKSNTNLSIGEAEVKFIQPNKDYSDNNDDSAVVLIDYKNTEIMVTGDISELTEQDMVNQNLIPDIDVLKVAHHGSKYSSSKSFLNKAKPENSVISVGKDNNYGHPTSDTLNRLTSSGSKVWRTDLNGNIVVKSDGNNINITASKENSNEVNSQGNWVKENGYWYYVKNGIKLKGWIDLNGTWYYLDNTGKMLTGWQLIENKWYYLESSGAMAKGWKQVGSTWYYLKPSGAMAKGWKQVGSKWYYLEPSGAMATGWKDLNGKWYYLKPSGAMATGWEQVGSKWYYMNTNGVMQKGWLQVGSKWYYLNQNGSMATGWLQVGSKWYYFYSSGVMATNTTIDGWKIDSNGVGSKINTGSNTNNGSNVNTESNTSNNSTVYVTPSGKSYHFTKNCTTLKRSKKILSVTLNQAKAQGKSDPCNMCVR